MRKRFIIAMLLSCVLFTGCSHNDTDAIQTTDEDVIDLNQSEDVTTSLEVDEIISVGDSGYKFSSDDSRIISAVKILDVASSSSNIVISPLSLDLMLGAAAGYGNDSAQDSFTNYFGADVSAFEKFVDNYMLSIRDADNVSIVNRVFIDDSIIKNVPDNHRDVISLDLDSPDAPSVINQIFSDKTNGAIQDVIFDTAGYESIFINTLYFKDDWDEPVAIVHENEVFSRFDGTEELVTMLDFTSNIYFENENAVGFAKLYENNRYGFIGILPNTEGDFQLIDMDLDSFLTSKTETNVKVFMPEFSLKNNMNLTSVFDSLGLDIFEPDMFDRLVENQAFTLSTIMHSVKIDVNRDGTEASSGASSFMVGAGMPEENPDERVVCLNRPFAFVIYDFENDVPMFIGKVVSVN